MVGCVENRETNRWCDFDLVAGFRGSRIQVVRAYMRDRRGVWQCLTGDQNKAPAEHISFRGPGQFSLHKF